ncbi:hypothetical protein HDZ31DRAFT_41368, partial [Schizophyllum fasciatum]
TPLCSPLIVGMSFASSTIVNSPDLLVSSVPVELWELIFNDSERADLLQTLLVCTGFNAIGKGVFWRRLRWRQPVKTLDAPTQLLSQGVALRVPRSLHLAIPLIDPHQAAVHDWLRWASTRVIGLDGSLVQLDDRIPQHGFAHLLSTGANIDRPDLASLPLYKQILVDITLFSLLQQLHLENAHLPTEVYSTITSLQQLRTLQFVNCSLPFPSRSDFPDRFLGLPIEALTIDRTLLRRGAQVSAGIAFTPQDPLVHPLFMATAHRLTSLMTGWKESFLFILEQKALYPTLRHLHVSFLRDSANGDGPLVLANLPRFLLLCPALRSLEIIAPARHSQMDAVSLPILERFTGPLSLARVISAQSLQELVLTDIRSVDSEALLEVVRTLPRSLEIISAKMGRWDGRILPVLAACVPRLRRLELTYSNGGPSLQYLINMGEAHLVRLRRLHTLRMYMDVSTAVHGQVAFQPGARELACRWSIPCETLRLVQLSKGCSWAYNARLHDWQGIVFQSNQ